MQHADNLIYYTFVLFLYMLRSEIKVTYLYTYLLTYLYILTVLCSIFGIRRDGGMVAQRNGHVRQVGLLGMD